MNDHQTFVAAPLVLHARLALESSTRPSKAGQSCSAVTPDASSDWKQDILLSVARNQSWKGLHTETAKPRKIRTMEVVIGAEEEAVEGAVVDEDVAEAAEEAAIPLGLLVRVKPRLLDNEKRHVGPIAGKEELGRWLELASPVRYRKPIIVEHLNK